MNKLTGICWQYNAITFDYCFEQSVQCLKDCCDEVIILDAGSTDGSSALTESLQDKKTRAILCSNEEWKSQQGKWKLSYFTNKAINQASNEYILSVQADEVLHEDCYDNVRRAIFNNYDGYLIKRINLWGSPYQQLNVPHDRLPCSTEILRLAKHSFRAYDDAESLGGIGYVTDIFLNDIRLYHFGFVRDRNVHAEKIRHMQSEVFLVTPDAKLEGMTTFQPEKWFDENDLAPISEPLPKLMLEWAAKRA